MRSFFYFYFSNPSFTLSEVFHCKISVCKTICGKKNKNNYLQIKFTTTRSRNQCLFKGTILMQTLECWIRWGGVSASFPQPTCRVLNYTHIVQVFLHCTMAKYQPCYISDNHFALFHNNLSFFLSKSYLETLNCGTVPS